MLSLRAAAGWDAGMTSETDKKALLGQLRIDRSEPPRSDAHARRTWVVVAAGLALAALLAIGAWLVLSARAAPVVHTVAAQAIGGGGGAASVLDATGYVTARRQATVSAQITGTVAAVLNEEGDHVKEGQVIGRLDDTAQRAALAQAQAQLHSAQALLQQAQALLAQNQRDVKRDPRKGSGMFAEGVRREDVLAGRGRHSARQPSGQRPLPLPASAAGGAGRQLAPGRRLVR